MLRAQSLAPSPMSPFLSESAHVLSLQHPGMEPGTPEGSASVYTPMTPSTSGLRTPLVTEETPRTSGLARGESFKNQRAEAASAIKLFVKTLKGVQSKLRGKSTSEVTSPMIQL